MTDWSRGPQYSIEFPLKDGRRLIKNQDGHARVTMPITFDSDGLRTEHSSAFLKSERFVKAYAAGAGTGHKICAPEDLHIEWRVYICCWAAEQALRCKGDFVECGVSTGITSRAIVDYCGFERQDKVFYLFDTYEGIPLDLAGENEIGLSRSKNERHYFDSYDLVVQNFSGFPNVRVVKGRVPDCLDAQHIEKVAYLHLDMNIAAPEVAALDYFWKRLVPGAIVILDDYGSQAHDQQKTEIDRWAEKLNVNLMLLPTGQGLIIA